MLKLRYFTPKEVANLLGFPPEFGMWDADLSFHFLKAPEVIRDSYVFYEEILSQMDVRNLFPFPIV